MISMLYKECADCVFVNVNRCVDCDFIYTCIFGGCGFVLCSTELSRCGRTSDFCLFIAFVHVHSVKILDRVHVRGR